MNKLTITVLIVSVLALSSEFSKAEKFEVQIFGTTSSKVSGAFSEGLSYTSNSDGTISTHYSDSETDYENTRDNYKWKKDISVPGNSVATSSYTEGQLYISEWNDTTNPDPIFPNTTGEGNQQVKYIANITNSSSSIDSTGLHTEAGTWTAFTPVFNTTEGKFVASGQNVEIHNEVSSTAAYSFDIFADDADSITLNASLINSFFQETYETPGLATLNASTYMELIVSQDFNGLREIEFGINQVDAHSELRSNNPTGVPTPIEGEQDGEFQLFEGVNESYILNADVVSNDWNTVTLLMINTVSLDISNPIGFEFDEALAEKEYLFNGILSDFSHSLTINSVMGTQGGVATEIHVEENLLFANSGGAFEGFSTLPSPSAVPEPTAMLLFGTGIASLAAVGRRRRT